MVFRRAPQHNSPNRRRDGKAWVLIRDVSSEISVVVLACVWQSRGSLSDESIDVIMNEFMYDSEGARTVRNELHWNRDSKRQSTTKHAQQILGGVFTRNRIHAMCTLH